MTAAQWAELDEAVFKKAAYHYLLLCYSNILKKCIQNKINWI